jgi:hypothetical protein
MNSKFNENLLLTLTAVAEPEVVMGVRLTTVGKLIKDQHRDDLEDQEDLKIAEKAMNGYRSGKVKAIPIDLVIRNLNLSVPTGTSSSECAFTSLNQYKR